MSRTLTSAEAKAFYDRFGAKQDWQAFYEDPAVSALLRAADLGEAHRVLELGCGTGRLAARLLSRELPADATYVGLDISSTMIELATVRLREFRERTAVLRTDGTTRLHFPDAHFDRFISTYVFDLLAERDIDALLLEAHRVLAPGGRICLAGLTGGTLLARAWSAIHALRPSLVGGCRPVDLRARLAAERWRLLHGEVVTRWGLPSDVLVAAKLT